MDLRSRNPERPERGLLADCALLARRFARRPEGLPLEPDSFRSGDPLLLAYWPLARTNNFQGLLYSQGTHHGVAPLAVPSFEDMAELPWAGPAACHFHWLASLDDAASIERFETVLKRLKDQRRSIIWTVHNVLPHDQADLENAIRVRRAIVEAADLIHIMNEQTPQLVAPYFSLDGKRLFYSPHPSYLGDQPATVSRADARFALGLSQETTVFLCFGAIQPYKGLENLIAAAETLALARPELDWTLVVAGLSKDQDLVDRIQRSTTLSRRLVFHPRRVPMEDVQLYFGAADYAVCAYRTSLNSGAAMLAMTFGVPLVAPMNAAFGDLLARGTGVGYPDEPGALAAALARAVESDPSEMRARALQVADERAPEKASDTFFERLTAGLQTGGTPIEVA